MQITSENIYCNSLIAVFDAAFKLGLDPYALAVQANLNLAKYWEFSPLMVSQRAYQVIEESLLTARLINDSGHRHQLSTENEQRCRGSSLANRLLALEGKR